MTWFTLLLRGLRHYWRWHLGLFAGVAAAAAVIAGSLVTGDSVRATLARQAEVRLGKVQTAVASMDGFFTADLGASMQPDLGGALVSPVLLVQGTVSQPDSGRRIPSVNVYGVHPDFWSLGTGQPPQTADALTLNRSLAAALGMASGTPGEVIVRFEKPSLLSRDAPLSGETDLTVTLRLPVGEIRDDAAMGAFSLKADQTPPLNVYLPLEKLQQAAELPGLANLLLSTAPDETATGQALAAHLTLADAGLTWKTVSGGAQVGTGRIFLAPETAAAVRAACPEARGILTYLVNEIRGPGEGLTPYSMATATEPGTGGLPEWPAGSVLVTQWLADDLGLKPGDTLSVKYYRVTRARQLEEATATFPVHAVLPMDHPAVNAEWTPDFPGVSESENCRDWKPGIPIRQDIIRDKDDQYWREHKGTPKFFLTLTDGQKLWQNRFGDLTALRVSGSGTPAALGTAVLAKLTPAAAGLHAVGVRASADKSVAQSMDFGSLFVSMSAFLIGTALLLAVMLFLLGVEQRSSQIGLLRATGWPARRVQRLFVSEALLVCVPAALLGLLPGLLYTRWTLGRLEGEWADAALGLTFLYTVKPLTLAISAVSTILLALGAVWWITRRINRARPRTLLAGGALDEPGLTPGKTPWYRRFRVPPGVFTAGAAVMLLTSSRVPQHIAPMMFFGAAALLLIDGLKVLGRLLDRSERATAHGVPGIARLGLRNAVRRRGRSMAVAGLLAAGVFMVVALNAFRQDARLLPSDRGSGTGGFPLLAESTLPVYEDLNSPAGQDAWGLDPDETKGVAVIPFRARDGEEASCLNLNRAQTPRVLGVDPALLASRQAFPFAGTASGFSVPDGGSAWSLLDATTADGAVPAIMDQYSAMFALGKMVGNDVIVPDSQGNPVRLRLVALLGGTVLQGSVIISDSAFTRLYPDSGGFQSFLIDATPDRAAVWEKAAVQQLADRGFSVSRTADRLARFQAVQNTYLTIFSTLGGLALVLSTIGLGVLVARHVLERRAEFALLQAVGFRRTQLRQLVLAEHWFLFLAAILLGTLTALLAVWPNLKLAGAGGVPVRLLAVLLTSLLAGGLLFCWFAARLALGRNLTESLRHE